MKTAIVSFSLLCVSMLGCQAVAGLEARPTDPRVNGCALPASTGGRVRVANLVASDAKVDVCIRGSGAAYGRPILRDGGTDCQAGFAYAEVSAPFGAPIGKIDVKMITAGETCASGALAEASGITVGTDAIVTLAYLGAPGSARVSALAESSSVNAGSTKFRFVNAIAGSKPLALGVTKDTRLPTTVTASLLGAPVPFGGVEPAGTKPVAGSLDQNGYLTMLASDYQLGAAEDGTTKALLVASVSNKAAIYSLYAIGNAADPAHPVRGLFCDEGASAGVVSQCTLTPLSTLSIDVFNAGLYGANAPSEDARRPYIVDALAKRDSDVMCVVEVSRKSDRDQIAAAAASGAFKHAYAPQMDLGTPMTDPTTKDGVTPPPSTTSSCNGVDPAMVNDVYQCMIDNCSAKPGDPKSAISGDTSCLSSKCASKFLPLFGGDPSQQRCFDCIVTNASAYEPWDSGKQICTTEVRPNLAFHGENPSMILSRFPIKQTDVFVLPSTSFRRSVLYAEVEIEPGRTVDTYCAQLSSPFLDDTLPYTGNYGTSYDDEQKLQAQRLIAWVQSKSEGRPAIIAGDFHAGVAVAQGATKVLADLDPDVIKALRAAFVEAKAPQWKPTCTYCPNAKNPYNGDFVGIAIEGVYLANFPELPTTDESILFDTPVVPLPTGTTGMLSPSFGLNVRVIRP